MSAMNPSKLLTLALACAFCAPAMAQESLLDIYQRALQNDPAIREAEATYRAQAEVKPQTRSGLLPSLSLGSTRSGRFSDASGGFTLPQGGTSGSRTVSRQSSQNLSISLSQTLFDWSLYAQLKQADKRVVRAETDYEAAKQQLLIRVATAYFNVLAAEDNLASAVAAREAIARQLEQANRRFEVGLIAITDVQQSQAGFDTAVADEIDAQRALATSQEQLREIIGVIVDELAGPTDNLPLLSPDPADAEEWVRMALSQNLALVSQRLATDIASDQIDIDRGNRLPTLSLSAGYSNSTSESVQTNFPPGERRPSTTEPEGRNWSIDLRFPIFTGGLNRSRIQQSVYLHRAATETLERIARQTERQTRDAYLGVTSAISRVGALRQAVESNRTALRATEAGFEVGTQTTVDVLNTQNQLRRAETEYSRSRYQYMLDILSLKQAAGNLTVADL
ncbi:MAG TPA: TolC family outer membrane protein, partial [Gammaproteobacteria bacterium]|nr:TolC family outer membrane protein [Gammaproteobacteria bacterium]